MKLSSFPVRYVLILFILCSLVLGFIILSNHYESLPLSLSGLDCEDCNVVFITIDALRKDHLGCYGYQRNTSPTIDQFCNESLVFDQAVPQFSWTKPSMISIFTGLYSKEHGVTEYLETLVPGSDNILSNNIPTYTQVFKDNGYATIALVDNNMIKPGFGLESGFDVYNITHPTNHALDWLEQNTDQKFFMYLHYIEPHSPYDPNGVVKKRFKPVYSGKLNFTNAHLAYFTYRNISEEDISELNARYDADVLFADYYVGQILSELDNLSLTDNTIVVIASDHGEGLAEDPDYFVGHGHLFPTVTTVPFMIRIPGMHANRYHGIVEMIDLFPTLLDALDMDDPLQSSGVSIFSPFYRKEYGVCSAWGDNWIGIYTDGTLFTKAVDTSFYEILLNFFSGSRVELPSEEIFYEFEDDGQYKVISPPEDADFYYDAYAEYLKKESVLHKASLEDEQFIEEAKALGYLN